MTETLAGDVALVVDTNLFLECKALFDIPWHALGFANVELIVSRPVQQELDALRKNDRGRTFKKALAANKLIRELVTSGQATRVIREAEPRVTLSIMPASRIQPEINVALDPTVNDDAIILRMLQYKLENEASDVRLVTHDTGPMATAMSLGIPFIPIPDSWLMSEQDDATTKETNKLKTELQRLRSQEPLFVIKVRDENENEISYLTAEVGTYDPLTTTEVQSLMDEIELQFPVATEFGTEATTPKPQQFPAFVGYWGVAVKEFKPASDSDIRIYREELYPEWILGCREQLKNLHSRLDANVEWPKIDFVISNKGTRPATRSLVKFVTQGSIEMFPRDKSVDKNDVTTARGISSITLPNPPSPPRGVWKDKVGHSASRFAGLIAGGSNDPYADTMRHRLLGLEPMRLPEKRDPDSFYWKGGRSSIAQSVVELTCENWRHNVRDEHFIFRVTPSNSESIAGAIQCEIHAENLSEPAMLTLPVRIERIAKSTFDHAQVLITRLCVR